MSPKPSTEDSKSSQERWMVSYADLITLLLAFFVAMYSVSRLDQEKLAKAQESFRGAINLPSPVRPDLAPVQSSVGGTVSAPLMPLENPAPITPASQLRQMEEQLIRVLKATPDFKDVEIVATDRVIILRFKDLVFFDTGQAMLRPEVLGFLDKLALVLAAIPNEVLVEGHTDDRPISTVQFPSNWELSTARASALVRYLVEHGHFDPGRLSAAGYGPHRPVGDNQVESGRQANRRVDIIVRPAVASETTNHNREESKFAYLFTK